MDEETKALSPFSIVLEQEKETTRFVTSSVSLTRVELVQDV